jgi:hypothetical protein
VEAIVKLEERQGHVVQIRISWVLGIVGITFEPFPKLIDGNGKRSARCIQTDRSMGTGLLRSQLGSASPPTSGIMSAENQFSQFAWYVQTDGQLL